MPASSRHLDQKIGNNLVSWGWSMITVVTAHWILDIPSVLMLISYFWNHLTNFTQFQLNKRLSRFYSNILENVTQNPKAVHYIHWECMNFYDNFHTHTTYEIHRKASEFGTKERNISSLCSRPQNEWILLNIIIILFVCLPFESKTKRNKREEEEEGKCEKRRILESWLDPVLMRCDLWIKCQF